MLFRSGFSNGHENIMRVAQRAEQAGIAALALHGRTREDMYLNTARYGLIKEVKQLLSIPVIANGDCHNLDDAKAMLDQSGADGVMIGRAALGRPWLVGEIAEGLEGRQAPPRSSRDLCEAALEHYESLLDQFGQSSGVRHARKHLAAYVEHYGDQDFSDQERLELLTTSDPARARLLLQAIFDRSRQLNAA